MAWPHRLERAIVLTPPELDGSLDGSGSGESTQRRRMADVQVGSPDERVERQAPSLATKTPSIA